jgi:hypothetical protein
MQLLAVSFQLSACSVVNRAEAADSGKQKLKAKG